MEFADKTSLLISPQTSAGYLYEQVSYPFDIEIFIKFSLGQIERAQLTKRAYVNENAK